MTREEVDPVDEVRDRLASALADMSEWGDVWAELYLRGVAGDMHDPFTCPVARHLSEVIGDEVGVGSTDAQVQWDTRTSVPLPRNVFRFVAEFDRGKYPELESE